MRPFISLLLICFLGLYAAAQVPLCTHLFNPTYGVSEFTISVAGKKHSENYLSQAHNNLTSNFDMANMQLILKTIKKTGLTNLTAEQKNIIIKFRQNTSFLRSIFQTSEDRHESPKDFAHFVRDFGVLKDYLLMEDSLNAQHAARNILKKYSSLNFSGLLLDATPASKKSVKKYFKKILSETKLIMNQQTMTVDQVHDVRKNLRDVLRYMQIQNEVKFAKIAGSKTLNLNPSDDIQDNPQIQFLKKTNSKLGEVCDENAAKILNGELTEDSIIEFPIKIRPRVEYFLANYQILIED